MVLPSKFLYSTLDSSQLTITYSSWTNNCLANENTNGVDYKDEPQLSPAVPFMKRARGDVIDQAAAIGIDLPTEFIPKLPPTPGSANVIKSYLLSDGVTGVVSLCSH